MGRSKPPAALPTAETQRGDCGLRQVARPSTGEITRGLWCQHRLKCTRCTCARDEQVKICLGLSTYPSHSAGPGSEGRSGLYLISPLSPVKQDFRGPKPNGSFSQVPQGPHPVKFSPVPTALYLPRRPRQETACLGAPPPTANPPQAHTSLSNRYLFLRTH